MILSQKSQYAVRAVFELAKRHGAGPVAAARLAEAQYIPLRFLENILGELRQAGFVESVRGKEGGYRLSRPPAQVGQAANMRIRKTSSRSWRRLPKCGTCPQRWTSSAC